MNKKAKLYLLVLINLMVWGYVGYKIYGALQGDDDVDFNMTQAKIKPIDKLVEEQEEILALNYDDPFLKNGNFSGYYPPKHTSNSNQPKQTPVVGQPKLAKPLVANPIAILPLDIKYVGLVQNSTSGKLTALITFNGKSMIVKQNDIVEGYLIKTITAESILAIKGKEKLVVSK